MKYWYQTLAIAQRILLELFRRRRSLVFWTVFPISVLVLSSYIFAERAELSLAEALPFSTPSTLIGAALFFSCVGGTVATIVSEREQKTIKRLFLSPINGITYFLGIFLAYSVIGWLQSFTLYFISRWLGGQFNGSISLGLVIIFLSILSYVGVGFILGTQLAKRTEDVNTLVASFGVPLLLLGGAFLPTIIFPEKLLNIAWFNPIFHINEALTEVWADGITWKQLGEHFWFVTVFALFSIIASWFSYKRMSSIERNF